MKNLVKFIQANRVIKGSKEVLNALRSGTLEKIYVSKNCSKDLLDDLKHYSKLADVSLVKTKISSSELGTLCKKQYNIQVLGVIKK